MTRTGCLCCRARDDGAISPEQTAIFVLVAIRQSSIGHAETHLCDDHHGLMLVTIAAMKLVGVRGMLRPSSGGRRLSEELIEERRGEADDLTAGGNPIRACPDDD